MLNRLLLAFAALLMLPSAAMAETLDGSWALRINDTTIFRFDLRQTGEGEWSGVWARPRSYRNNGVIFSNLEGQAEVTSRNASVQGDALRLTFHDPRPRSLPEVFRFRITGEGRAELTYVDTGFAPLPLVRVAQDAEVGPFDEGRLYDRDNAQTAPTRLAVPTRAVPAPQPERPVQSARPVQELPALETPVSRPQPETELPARAAPAPRVQQTGQELPPVAAPSPPASGLQSAQELPVRATPAPRMPPQPATPAPVATTSAPSAPQSGAWQPDPSVSAAIAARAAALEGATAAAPQPRAEPERPAPAPPPAPGTPQAGNWQPDPSVRAAVAARAAALNGSVEPGEEPEAAPAKPDSRLGADFLDGI